MKALCVIGLWLSMTSIAFADIPLAYQKIARQYQIPVDVFFAVMLQESGKTIQKDYVPWPWVLNVEEVPYFFDNRESAERALLQFLAVNPQARIAVGIGQIYLPSHGHLFEDKTVLLSPATNLHYAAKVLLENFEWTLKNDQPNWWVAVGRYHTPSKPLLAKAYRESVFKKCQKISERCTQYGAI